MSDAALDDPVRILAREFLRVGTWLRVRRAVGIAFKSNRGYSDHWARGETLFEIIIFRLTFSQAKTPTVIVNHDLNMIRVV